MKFLSTSALALLVAAPMAFAQSADVGETTLGQTTTDGGLTMGSHANLMEMQGELIRTRDITGGNVYTMNEADDEGWDPEYMHTEVGADWNQIGEIEDIVLSRSGQMMGIIVEVGGFLDIGDSHVMIPVENVNLVAVDDTTYTYVTRYNEEELEEMESVDEGFWN